MNKRDIKVNMRVYVLSKTVEGSESLDKWLSYNGGLKIGTVSKIDLGHIVVNTKSGHMGNFQPKDLLNSEKLHANQIWFLEYKRQKEEAVPF